jgi:hypothetical protein
LAINWETKESISLAFWAEERATQRSARRETRDLTEISIGAREDWRIVGSEDWGFWRPALGMMG